MSERLLPSLLLGAVVCGGCPAEPEPPLEGLQPGEPLGLELPRRSVEADEVGVIVNTDDPLSALIADAYLSAREIPSENRLELALGLAPNLDRVAFAVHQAAIDDAFGDRIQVVALTSMAPMTVDCMGMSAAVALGFDDRWCQPGPPCNTTDLADTYDSETTSPYTDHGIRPTMILAASTLQDAEDLIARGIAADGALPTGRGFAVRTSDSARSTRWPEMLAAVQDWYEVLDLTYVDNSDGTGSDLIEDEDDLLFYFTGLTEVAGIESNTWRPGAVADHLTSLGGQLPTSSQMSALAWLQAGATASYGTAIEPCNYATKFPNPEALIPHYLGGNTVVEAYWKSVWMPGEGNFVGEPLARPWGGARTAYEDGLWTITTTNLVPDQRYALEVAEVADGPWEHVERIEFEDLDLQTIAVSEPLEAWYRLIED